MSDLAEIRNYSVTDEQPDTPYGTFGMLYAHEDAYIAPWGTWQRQHELRRLAYNMHNTLVVGALTNLIRRIKQVPWELVGGRNLTLRYQSILQNAEYGQGWDAFLSRVLFDFLTLDHGAFVQVVGVGAADTPLTGAALGITALDGLRCYPTGNDEYPVYYQSARTGKLHKLHYTRVYRLVDQPSPDPDYRGMGLSAMSRSLAIAEREGLVSRYIGQSLNDMPTKGMLAISGLRNQQFSDVMDRYEQSRQAKHQDVFRNLVRFDSVDPENPISIEYVPFSTDPAGFDWIKYTENDVYQLALAIGDDPTEIWPLMGQGLGTGTQSKVLNAKGKARIFGDILTMLERMLNIAILPRSLEFKFKPKDTEQAKEDAESAQLWGTLIGDLVTKGVLTVDEGRLALANTISAYADVLLDEAGQVRVPDDDVDKPPVVTAEGTTELDTPPASANDDDFTIANDAKVVKAIQATRLNFEDAFTALLADAMQEQVDRRTFARRARAMVSRGVRQAFLDGLEEGGVFRGDLSDEDTATIQRLTAQQSVYVTNLGAALFRQDDVTPAMASQKPSMWFNKSVYPAYDAGRMSADRNGYYEWSLGRTEKHCSTCLALNGQVHRLKDYTRRDLVPKSSVLECGGWQCDCKLNKRTGVRARGRLPRT